MTATAHVEQVPTYPTVRRVLQAPIGSERRRRVLGVIAAFIDEGQEPALREIASRAGLKNWKHAEWEARRLEAQGLLKVEWVGPDARAEAQANGAPTPRNRYTVLA